MALNNNDQARIREYLLGRLTDDEQETIEERLMIDDELFEELEISKGQLIEEYSSGELSKTDRESFENNYLASPEARKRHTFSLAMDRLAQRKQPSPAPRPLSFFDRIRVFLNWQRLAFAGGSAALLLAVGALLFFPRTPVFVSVDLTSNAANRAPGARQYHRISQNPNIDEFRFTLKIPQSATPRTGYVVELDNQTDTTTFTPLSQDQSSVLVAIPAGKLPPGIYALRLQVELPDGTTQREPWEYYFEVTK